MKLGAAVSVVVVAALLMVQLGARPSEGISCGQVSGALMPCVPYLTQGGTPTQSCCRGVKSLRNMTPTQQDRRSACECVKSAARNYPSLKPDAASNLPSRCGVPISIPISANTNCNSIP